MLTLSEAEIEDIKNKVIPVTFVRTAPVETAETKIVVSRAVI